MICGPGAWGCRAVIARTQDVTGAVRESLPGHTAKSTGDHPHMKAASQLEPIPHPPGHLLVGNLFDLDTSDLLGSLADLARQYGPIYQLQLPGRGTRVIISGYALVDELCDETRFDKMLGPGL